MNLYILCIISFIYGMIGGYICKKHDPNACIIDNIIWSLFWPIKLIKGIK